MILDHTGKPFQKTEQRRGMHTDAFRLSRACNVPKSEYRKAMLLLERGDVREKIDRGDRQRGAKTIYLDILRPKDKASSDAKSLIHKHQKAFEDVIEERSKVNFDD